MKNISLVVSAVITAILSTACCVPAFLFLFFGVSAGSLSFLTELDFVRVPFAILSISLLGLFFVKNKQKVSCQCNSESGLVKSYITIVLLGLFIGILLFYPEFLVYFVE